MNKSRTNLKRNLYVWAVASGLLISSHAYAGHLPPLSDQARQNAREQIKVLAGLKAALSTTEQKLDSQFIFALRADSNGVVHPSVPKLRHGLKFEQDGRLKVEIVGTVTPELLKAVQTAGGTVLSAWPETRSLFALMPLAAIKTIAKLGGMGDDQVDKCLSDNGLLNEINARKDDAMSRYKVDSTPSFIIGGKLYSGDMPYDEFAKLLSGQGK